MEDPQRVRGWASGDELERSLKVIDPGTAAKARATDGDRKLVRWVIGVALSAARDLLRSRVPLEDDLRSSLDSKARV